MTLPRFKVVKSHASKTPHIFLDLYFRKMVCTSHTFYSRHVFVLNLLLIKSNVSVYQQRSAAASLFVCVSVFLSCCLPVWLSVYLTGWPASWLARFLYLSSWLPGCLSVCLSICLSVYLPFCLSSWLTDRLAVCLFACLFICVCLLQVKLLPLQCLTDEKPG